jgi:predicted MFS family arabinose efflux permease
VVLQRPRVERRAYRRGVTPPARPPSGRPGRAGSAATGKAVQHRRPAVLALLCALVVLQAGALVGMAVAFVTDLVRGVSQLPGATMFLALFALGLAAVLVQAARGLWAGRRWARSPVMTWQVLLVVMGVGWLTADPTWWVVAVLVSAVVVGVGLLLPRVVAATVDRPRA